jgi:hypothetical protein
MVTRSKRCVPHAPSNACACGITQAPWPPPRGCVVDLLPQADPLAATSTIAQMPHHGVADRIDQDVRPRGRETRDSTASATSRDVSGRRARTITPNERRHSPRWSAHIRAVDAACLSRRGIRGRCERLFRTVQSSGGYGHAVVFVSDLRHFLTSPLQVRAGTAHGRAPDARRTCCNRGRCGPSVGQRAALSAQTRPARLPGTSRGVPH